MIILMLLVNLERQVYPSNLKETLKKEAFFTRILSAESSVGCN